ncbi:MAG: cell division protein FtsK [Gammaproteobacteria bacterium]|nr:cell division protein FtsK [Gammaproteobacteria bacterium]
MKKSKQKESRQRVVTGRPSVTVAKPPASRRHLIEGLLILGAAFAIYLLIALVSWHRGDPGWSTTGSGVVANAGGRAGAWISDLLLYLFGYPAYFLPLLFVGWLLFLHFRQAAQRGSWSIVSKVVGLLLLVMTAPTLSYLIWPLHQSHLPTSGGGIIGSMIAAALQSRLSTPGSTLLLVAGLLIGFNLFFEWSWWRLSRYVAKVVTVISLFCCRLTNRVFGAIKAWWQQRRQAAALVVAQTAATQPAAAVPPPLSLRPERMVRPTISAVEPPPTALRPTATVVKAREKPVRPTKKAAQQSGQLPPLDLLEPPQNEQGSALSHDQLIQMSQILIEHLAHFGVEAEIAGIQPGPVVTRFEVTLAPGVKVSKVSNLDKDLARSMSMPSVRVVEIIAGKSVIGIEVPNAHREAVSLREIVASDSFQQSRAPLTLVLGKTISGQPMVGDLSKMPHLLVAGTTGSGKSVALNVMLLSLLYKLTPKELRLILIDPKMLELSVYKDIPHLLTPVVTDMKKAGNALRWAIQEMERRYRLMAALGVRNLAGLNSKLVQAERVGKPILDPMVESEDEALALEPLANIVIVIDELADMMMVVGKKVEELIARIAQKARAAGIHMILATQRPSVDVITGLIKANVPCRIAFRVSSRIDSRTILDQQGAQQLLGYGDMLFMPPGSSFPVRVHGPYVSDDEIDRIASAVKSYGQPDYLDEITHDEESIGATDGGDSGETDPLYDQSVAIVIESGRASISLVQRRLRIGYNRAATLLETMERAGLVSSMQGNGSREVLVPTDVEQ